MASVAPEQQSRQAGQPDGDEHPETPSADTILPTAHIPNGTLAHPEVHGTLTSRPGQISYLVMAGRYRVTLDQETSEAGIVTETGEPWIVEHPNPSMQEPLGMHIECTFLTANALRVRIGLEASFPFPNAYPVDPDFPPPALRKYLFPPGASTEPVAGGPRDDLSCGLDLRANDGEMWINPRGTGLELYHSSSPFGLRATWRMPPRSSGLDANTSDGEDNDKSSGKQTDRHRDPVSGSEGPVFEQAHLGPFSPPVLLPGGLMNIDSTLVGTELFWLAPGEKIQSGGPGRHRARERPLSLAAPEPGSQLASESEQPATETADDSRGVDVTPVPKGMRDEMANHFGGHFVEEPMSTLPPPFLHTDRGWGILMKDPVQVRLAWLLDGRAEVALMMGAGEKGMVEYIVVMGEALEACKEEYPVE
ncbi:MAG: hypothetical protein Q9161_004389 [Pseudevernia consocians]